MVSQIPKHNQQVEKERTASVRCPQDRLTLTPPKVYRANLVYKINLFKNGQFSPSSGCLLCLTPLCTGTSKIYPSIYMYHQ